MKKVIYYLTAIALLQCCSPKAIFKTEEKKERSGDSPDEIKEEKNSEKVLKSLVVYPESIYEDAKSKALKESKNIFVFFTAEWCAPCHKLERETFSAEALANQINNKFVPFKAEEESFDGLGLRQEYEVKAYPTIMVISPEGKELFRTVGLQYWPKLMEELKPFE